MITVTKPYLPSIDEFGQYLQGIWHRGQLSNNGPLEMELEHLLKEYLGVKHLHLVSSGTMALQIALRSLNLEGEIITTAFSHISTVNSILWNNCKPVFVDIENENFCIDPACIEKAVTKNTCAILATHVYGYPCQVEKIEAIAEKYRLKVVYDGAHAFGVKLNGHSLLGYGDVTAVSFHATKIFHTVEGGAIITNNSKVAESCEQLRNFGLRKAEPVAAGINGKISELHAAMGLCNLKKMSDFIEKRRQLSQLYYRLLPCRLLRIPELSAGTEHNFAYQPVLFDSHAVMLTVYHALASVGVQARRYFTPSLNKLPYLSGASCPVAEDVAGRILCLPLYYDLSEDDVVQIADAINRQLEVFSNTGTLIGYEVIT